MKTTDDLHTFLNAAAGEGLELDGVDAANLYASVFPERYKAATQPTASNANVSLDPWPSNDQIALARQDAGLLGRGFTVDGMRVSPERVVVVHPADSTQATASNAGELPEPDLYANFDYYKADTVRELLRAALASKPPAGEQKPVGVVVLRRSPPGPPHWSEERAEVKLNGDVDLPDDALVYASAQPEQVAQNDRLLRDAYDHLRFAWRFQNERAPGTTNYGLESTLRALADRFGEQPSPWWKAQAEQVAQDITVLERCERLFKEALPKFNWGASFLDANAIALLNEVPGEVSKAIRAAHARGEVKP